MTYRERLGRQLMEELSRLTRDNEWGRDRIKEMMEKIREENELIGKRQKEMDEIETIMEEMGNGERGGNVEFNGKVSKGIEEG